MKNRIDEIVIVVTVDYCCHYYDTDPPSILTELRADHALPQTLLVGDRWERGRMVRSGQGVGTVSRGGVSTYL